MTHEIRLKPRAIALLVMLDNRGDSLTVREIMRSLGEKPIDFTGLVHDMAALNLVTSAAGTVTITELGRSYL